MSSKSRINLVPNPFVLRGCQMMPPPRPSLPPTLERHPRPQPGGSCNSMDPAEQFLVGCTVFSVGVVVVWGLMALVRWLMSLV